MVLIDFKKAFDTLSWDYIRKSLEFFIFSETVITLVMSLQEHSNSKILQNGNLLRKKIWEGGVGKAIRYHITYLFWPQNSYWKPSGPTEKLQE